MTFSLLGRCARTGQLGVAVTTSDIAVGARVPHAAARVGVAVTQHRTDPRLGPQMLDLLRAGCTPREAVGRTAADTRHRGWRQLAVLDAAGSSAAFSGAKVTPTVAALEGPDCFAVGNMLTGEDVARAIVGAFAAHKGEPLAARLLAGLQAGEEAGGEQAALRSAALLVVEREAFPLVDLRIDAAGSPLTALDSLWREYEPCTEDFVRRALDPDRASGKPDHQRPSSTTT
jgi:uncharacterized Ntn-hydrolase superfamily protein